MTALLDDGALLHDDDPVRCLHGGQTVRDQDAGGIFQDQVQRLLNLPFGERVNTGGGFVQNEDGGILYQHAHQRPANAIL